MAVNNMPQGQDPLALLMAQRQQAAQAQAQQQAQMGQIAAMAGPMLKGLGQPSPQALAPTVPGQTMTPIVPTQGLPQGGMSISPTGPLAQAMPGLTPEQIAMLQGMNRGPLTGFGG